MHAYLKFKKPSRSEIGAVALAAACAIALVLMYRGMGIWLVINDQVPENPDVIFTFGGETIRDRYSRDLALRHPEAVWILSTYNAGARMRLLDLNEFDQKRLVVVDTLKSTWDEVKFLRAWIKKEEQRHRDTEAQRTIGVTADSSTRFSTGNSVPPWQPSVLLVSGPYHMRRIKIAAVRLLNHVPCRLFYTPAPMTLYNHTPARYRYWWRDTSLAPVVKQEWVKTMYYLVRL